MPLRMSSDVDLGDLQELAPPSEPGQEPGEWDLDDDFYH
jgi:hypothetical protein